MADTNLPGGGSSPVRGGGLAGGLGGSDVGGVEEALGGGDNIGQGSTVGTSAVTHANAAGQTESGMTEGDLADRGYDGGLSNRLLPGQLTGRGTGVDEDNSRDPAGSPGGGPMGGTVPGPTTGSGRGGATPPGDEGRYDLSGAIDSSAVRRRER